MSRVASVATMSRTVSLALVDDRGNPLGRLPPFEVELPWWQESASIVAGARDRYAVEVTILRLISTTPATQSGGAVTYLAEATGIPPTYAGSIDVDLSPHPLRAPYAEPGGPRASLDWAAAVLREAGYPFVTGAAQHRTWNLSTIWRLETAAGPAWLKQVPTFFQHEPAVLRWLAGVDAPAVPVLLASDGGRMLLEHLPGEDLYGATMAQRAEVGARFHRLQAPSVAAVDQLLAAGVPDLRAAALVERIAEVVRRYGGGDPVLGHLVEELPDRLATIASYGLPDALVHGDLHPGNARSDGGQPVILDWGDTFIGNPGFDIIRLTETLGAADAKLIVQAWDARWRAEVPDSEPTRAMELLRPVAALRSAVVYASFVDNIEPTEHPYHAADVPQCLDTAKRLATTAATADVLPTAD